jgi:hypothetical protein
MTATVDSVPRVCAQMLDGAAKMLHEASEKLVYDRTSGIQMVGEVEGIVKEVAIQLRSAAIV